MTDRTQDDTEVRFDDIRVELDGHRLFRAGQEVSLEPKAFAVLREMLQRPGHAFSRDELLDAVWGHRHVTPGVLVRVIGLLRRALGDDSERYLQTVHGVGYRLVLPPAARVAAPAEQPVVPDAASADGVVVPDAAPRPAPPAVAERRRPSASTPATGGRRRWLLAGLALALAVLAWPGREMPPAPMPAPPADNRLTDTAAPLTLAVLPLRALGDDPRGQDFADGLSEELITALARIDGLRVSASSASLPYRASGLPMADVAKRLGASHVLEGSVRQDGERLRIALRLVDVTGDRALWSESFDRSLQDIFAVQAEITRAVAEVLRLRLVLATPAAGNEDPALYRRFLLARQPYSRTPGVQTAAEAEAALRSLLAEHPDYPRGWGALANLQFERSLRPRADSGELLLDAERAAARALALDPGQPEALAVMAGQACREQRWGECLAQSRRVVRLAPSDLASRQNLGVRLAIMGYTDQALAELQEAAAINPDSTDVQLRLGRVLDTLGRHDEARVALARADPLRARTARVLNALWRQDLADARRLVLAIPADDHWRASMLATVDALEDPRHWPRAQALIEASEGSLSPAGEAVDYNFMRMWLPDRDYARDVAALDQTQRVGYASYQLVFWQPESHALRQSPAFHAYLRDSGLLALWRSEGWPAFCRPAGDAVACD